MANMNTAAQYNSEQMGELLAALKGVMSNIEQAAQELSKPCAFFLQDDCPISGKDSEPIIEAYRQIKTQSETALGHVSTMHSALNTIMEKMNISMDYAGKTSKECADALTTVSQKIADSKNAKN